MSLKTVLAQKSALMLSSAALDLNTLELQQRALQTGVTNHGHYPLFSRELTLPIPPILVAIENRPHVVESLALATCSRCLQHVPTSVASCMNDSQGATHPPTQVKTTQQMQKISLGISFHCDQNCFTDAAASISLSGTPHVTPSVPRQGRRFRTLNAGCRLTSGP